MDEEYSTHGAICPHCGHLNRASDSDCLLYDEEISEWECDACDTEFEVSPFLQWSWTSRPKKEVPDE